MAARNSVVTSGTGQAADHIVLPRGTGWYRIFCRWASTAGAGTLQERPLGGSSDDWADIPTESGVADVTSNTSFIVPAGAEISVFIDTHSSVLTVTAEQFIQK